MLPNPAVLCGGAGASQTSPRDWVALRVPLGELVASVARDAACGPGPPIAAALLPWARTAAICCCCWRYCLGRGGSCRRCCRRPLIHHRAALAHGEVWVQLDAGIAADTACAPGPALPTA